MIQKSVIISIIRSILPPIIKEIMRLCLITLSITFGNKDKNITFEDKVEERKYKGKNSLFYFWKLIHSPKRCKLCGHENTSYSIIKNGFKKHCSYFTAETPVVERNYYISKNTRLAVLNKSIDIRSQKICCWILSYH